MTPSPSFLIMPEYDASGFPVENGKMDQAIQEKYESLSESGEYSDREIKQILGLEATR
tara:strand:- start:89 stop:262 length:174 start_codon:yes stop_codon:yes gene_type:complete